MTIPFKNKMEALEAMIRLMKKNPTEQPKPTNLPSNNDGRVSVVNDKAQMTKVPGKMATTTTAKKLMDLEDAKFIKGICEILSLKIPKVVQNRLDLELKKK